MQNFINWFEIPATHFQRAVDFYSSILTIEITEQDFMDTKMGFFPSDGNNVSGAVVMGQNNQPAQGGILIYLNGGHDLSLVLNKVAPAGGNVIVPKTKISDEMGYFAMFIDTEGNTMALHSPN